MCKFVLVVNMTTSWTFVVGWIRTLGVRDLPIVFGIRTLLVRDSRFLVGIRTLLVRDSRFLILVTVIRTLLYGLTTRYSYVYVRGYQRMVPA